MAWGLNNSSITIFGPTPTNRVYETVLNKVIKSPSAGKITQTRQK